MFNLNSIINHFIRRKTILNEDSLFISLKVIRLLINYFNNNIKILTINVHLFIILKNTETFQFLHHRSTN